MDVRWADVRFSANRSAPSAVIHSSLSEESRHGGVALLSLEGVSAGALARRPTRRHKRS